MTGPGHCADTAPRPFRPFSIYDKITEEASEYYLYNAELELFKAHGREIAEAMGFPAAGGVDDDKTRAEVARGLDVVELGAG